MIQFHENTDRRQDRRMDTTYFIHRIILATAGSPTITTAVDWHNVSLIKSIASQLACKKSAQFINSLLRYSRFSGLMNTPVLITPTQKSLK